MITITGLTNDASQQFVLDGIPTIEISCTLTFRPRMQQWYIDITYGTFTVQGIAVVCSPNLLYQWKNIIPFGIACTNVNYLDPYTINDFSSGNSILYLLDSTDLASIAESIYA